VMRSVGVFMCIGVSYVCYIVYFDGLCVIMLFVCGGVKCLNLYYCTYMWCLAYVRVRLGLSM